MLSHMPDWYIVKLFWAWVLMLVVGIGGPVLFIISLIEFIKWLFGKKGIKGISQRIMDGTEHRIIELRATARFKDEQAAARLTPESKLLRPVEGAEEQTAARAAEQAEEELARVRY